MRPRSKKNVTDLNSGYLDDLTRVGDNRCVNKVEQGAVLCARPEVKARLTRQSWVAAPLVNRLMVRLMRFDVTE